MKYTHILWDFNGTILDDVSAGIKSVNKLLSERGLPIVKNVKEYHSVFGFPIIDYYRRLGFDFDREPYESIAPLWVEQYLINVRCSHIFDDVISSSQTFRKMGLKQVIISATELDMLTSQLKDLGLEGVFDGVFGLDNIHASSKVGIAEKWRKENPTARAVMIGDTVHDAEVAKAIDADCILVARGHQSRRTLEECGCIIVDTLAEIIEKQLY